MLKNNQLFFYIEIYYFLKKYINFNTNFKELIMFVRKNKIMILIKC